MVCIRCWRLFVTHWFEYLLHQKTLREYLRRLIAWRIIQTACGFPTRVFDHWVQLMVLFELALFRRFRGPSQFLFKRMHKFFSEWRLVYVWFLFFFLLLMNGSLSLLLGHLPWIILAFLVQKQSRLCRLTNSGCRVVLIFWSLMFLWVFGWYRAFLLVVVGVYSEVRVLLVHLIEGLLWLHYFRRKIVVLHVIIIQIPRVLLKLIVLL